MIHLDVNVLVCGEELADRYPGWGGPWGFLPMMQPLLFISDDAWGSPEHILHRSPHPKCAVSGAIVDGDQRGQLRNDTPGHGCSHVRNTRGR